MLFGYDQPGVTDSLSCHVGAASGRHYVGHAAVLSKHTHELCMYLPDHGSTMTRPEDLFWMMEEFKVRWSFRGKKRKKMEDFQGNAPEFLIWKVLDGAISDWEDKMIVFSPVYIVYTWTMEMGNWPSLAGCHILTAGG